MKENSLPALRNMLNDESVKNRFKEMLGKKAPGFISSVLNVVNGNADLSQADMNSIVGAAAVAATLDLPIDPNLGFAAIIPFKSKIKGTGSTPDRWVTKAQFQIMYKGLNQLAMRSGQYQTIGASPIYKGQLLSSNPLTSVYEFDFTVEPKGSPVGYAAYFKLINGFEKVVYWPIDKIDKHGKRFSKSYAKNFGLWKDDFENMAIKTVLKNLLSKWGILSIEMQNAVKFDQGVIDGPDTQEVQYIDNDENGNKSKELAPNPFNLNGKKESDQNPLDFEAENQKTQK